MANRRTLDNLIATMIPEIRDIFIAVMQDIVDEAIMLDVISAIERGDAEGAFKAIGFTPAALSPLLDAIERVYKDGGGITADDFPRIRTPFGSVVFRFDVRNPRAEQELREHSSNLVTRITEEARQNVRVALERGMIAGTNPRRTALDIVGRVDPVTKKRTGGVIGLTNAQERWAANVRTDLMTLDKRYFTRTLRDKRFDTTVKKAIDEGKDLTMEQIERLTMAYKNRALKYRADMIAQTETIQGINRSENRAHEQAIEEGVLSRNAIKKDWDSAGDGRVRFSHKVMDVKYRKNPIPFDEPFLSPSGARMMFPGDQSLGAEGDEVIGCRCRRRVKVDWFKNEEIINGR